jgi:Fic family protein
MDASLFTEDAPGKLVPVSTEYGDDWAFVPDPLPPELDLTGISKAHEEATLALGELKGLGRDIARADLFIRPFIRREAQLGSIIEGTVVDIKDLYVYETGQLRFPGVGDRQEAALREVLNYVKAIEFALEQEELPLSLRLIRKLHEILTSQVRGGEAEAGEFRRLPAGIRGETLKEAAFIAAPVNALNECLARFEEYLRAEDKYSNLIRLAFVHYQFETIHPFRDGNGRIGRLLIHLLLVEWGLLQRPLLYLSRYFEKNKNAYCESLFNVSAKGAWEEWLIFFLQAVTSEARDTIKRISRLQELQSEWRRRLSKERASALTLRLADNLIENPIINYALASDVLSEDYFTARNCVNRLAESGILSDFGRRGNRKTFICEPVFDVLFYE